MTIEEERKAFEDWEKSGMPDIGPWQAWLSAKAHAEEMARLRVKIIQKRVKAAYPFIAVLLDGSGAGTLEDFHTKEDAAEWAERNGYRVVSE